MVGYIIKRVLSIIPIVFLISFLVFLITYLTPGDPVETILGDAASEKDEQMVRAEYGLNKPFITQYFLWLKQIMHGNFGQSITMHIPVENVLFKSIINTFILATGSLIICLVVGISIGFFAGLRQKSWFDRVSIFLVQVAANIPSFWIGLVLMWVFSVKLGWLPSSGMYDMRNEGSFLSLLEHLVLPATAASLVSLTVIAKMTRSNVVDVMNADYIKTFRSRGIPKSAIIRKHLFRNVLSPIVSVTGLQVGMLFTGALFVETVFNWPGVGTLLYNAITAQDTPIIQGGILFVSVIFVVVNLITDIIIDLLNPRLRQ